MSDTTAGLTADELAVAKASGMTPEEYAAYKTPAGAAAWEAEREEREAKEPIKQAVREASPSRSRRNPAGVV